MKFAITGFKTTISQAFSELVGTDAVFDAGRGPLPTGYDGYLICQGYLAGKTARNIRTDEGERTWADNFMSIVARVDRLIDRDRHARVCIIGSESGFKGSFDACYAGSKAAIHLYIETKKLTHSGQQIVGIAPHILRNSGMTSRRSDYADCMKRGRERRRGDWIAAMDVAKLARFLLVEDSGNICNTVVRMNGGVE